MSNLSHDIELCFFHHFFIFKIFKTLSRCMLVTQLINQSKICFVADSAEFNSFKTEIFAINLNSTFDFQFQSIKSLIRRSDASKVLNHCSKKAISRHRKHRENRTLSAYKSRLFFRCFQRNIEHQSLRLLKHHTQKNRFENILKANLFDIFTSYNSRFDFCCFQRSNIFF